MSPWALPKPCTVPGCPNKQPCKVHNKPRTWNRDKRPQSQERGYGSDWQKARKIALKRHDFVCQRCGRRAQLVHHRDHDPANNDQSNLEPLCRDCHEAHHGRKKG